VQDLFGDIVRVRAKARFPLSLLACWQYIDIRGLDNMFLDMVDAPEYMHELLAFLAAGQRGILRQLIAANLLSLNNDSTYHSSGGVGYSDELPAPGFREDVVRPCDLWGSAQSQEGALISPAMHRDFFMRYEAQLIEPFASRAMAAAKTCRASSTM